VDLNKEATRAAGQPGSDEAAHPGPEIPETLRLPNPKPCRTSSIGAAWVDSSLDAEAGALAGGGREGRGGLDKGSPAGTVGEAGKKSAARRRRKAMMAYQPPCPQAPKRRQERKTSSQGWRPDAGDAWSSPGGEDTSTTTTTSTAIEAETEAEVAPRSLMHPSVEEIQNKDTRGARALEVDTTLPLPPPALRHRAVLLGDVDVGEEGSIVSPVTPPRAAEWASGAASDSLSLSQTQALSYPQYASGERCQIMVLVEARHGILEPTGEWVTGRVTRVLGHHRYHVACADEGWDSQDAEAGEDEEGLHAMHLRAVAA